MGACISKNSDMNILAKMSLVLTKTYANSPKNYKKKVINRINILNLKFNISAMYLHFLWDQLTSKCILNKNKANCVIDQYLQKQAFLHDEDHCSKNNKLFQNLMENDYTIQLSEIKIWYGVPHNNDVLYLKYFPSYLRQERKKMVKQSCLNKITFMLVLVPALRSGIINMPCSLYLFGFLDSYCNLLQMKSREHHLYRMYEKLYKFYHRDYQHGLFL